MNLKKKCHFEKYEGEKRNNNPYYLMSYFINFPLRDFISVTCRYYPGFRFFSFFVSPFEF